MKKHFTIDGRVYHATSKKAAMEEHAAVIKRVLAAADQTPIVLQGAANTIIVFAHDGWWNYSFLRHRPCEPIASGEIALEYSGTCCGTMTRRVAELSARRHLAQIECNPDHIHRDDEAGRVEHARWARWQDAYRAARDTGANDAAARQQADRVINSAAA